MLLELRPPTSPSHSRWYPGQRADHTENTCESGVTRGGTVAQNWPASGSRTVKRANAANLVFDPSCL